MLRLKESDRDQLKTNGARFNNAANPAEMLNIAISASNEDVIGEFLPVLKRIANALESLAGREMQVNLPPMQVNVPAPNIQVAAPTVNVAAPTVNVAAPEVHVAAPNVTVEPSMITVPAPIVTVQVPKPELPSIVPPEPKGKHRFDIHRNQKGQIDSLTAEPLP
jgi:hypothetical protein